MAEGACQAPDLRGLPVAGQDTEIFRAPKDHPDRLVVRPCDNVVFHAKPNFQCNDLKVPADPAIPEAEELPLSVGIQPQVPEPDGISALIGERSPLVVSGGSWGMRRKRARCKLSLRVVAANAHRPPSAARRPSEGPERGAEGRGKHRALSTRQVPISTTDWPMS